MRTTGRRISCAALFVLVLVVVPMPAAAYELSGNGPKSCLAEEAGKSVCNRCLERCNAGDSPSSKCRKCLF
jgi:hypothetical protein